MTVKNEDSDAECVENKPKKIISDCDSLKKSKGSSLKKTSTVASTVSGKSKSKAKEDEKNTEKNTEMENKKLLKMHWIRTKLKKNLQRKKKSLTKIA